MSEQGESEATVMDTLEAQERPSVSAPRALPAVLLVRDAAAKQEYLEALSVHERLLKLTRHLSR